MEMEQNPNANGQLWKWDGASTCAAHVIRSSLHANLQAYPHYKLIWHPQGAPRMSVCAIRALHNLLPTTDRIYSNQLPCYLCNNELESIQHLFYECQYSHHV